MRLFIADVCQALLIKTPENVVVLRGNPTTLECRHNGSSIRWLKYGANLTGGYEIVLHWHESKKLGNVFHGGFWVEFEDQHNEHHSRWDVRV